MANIDDIAYAIGADKKNPTGIKDWFGRVVSLSPFKVARLGSEIGVECAFSNISHFIKLFKLRYKETPAAFRRRHSILYGEEYKAILG